MEDKLFLDVEPFSDEDVSIQIKENSIIISGNIEYTDPSTNLEPFFEKIHQSALKNNLKLINIDLTDLNYINSSGITIFVKWIINLQQLPESQKYSLKFICNPEHKWQQQSITMLAKTAPRIISIA